MKVKPEVIHGKELAKKFRTAGEKAQSEIDKALLKGGLLVERTAKIYQTPHVLTGRLRASIATRLVPMNVLVGTTVVYARKHEKDYPFLRPALEDKETEVKEILRKGLINFMTRIFPRGFAKI